MKVHAIGAVRLTGKKDGRDYDFAQLHFMSPAEPVRTFASGASESIGNEPNTLEISVSSWPKFKTLQIPLGGLELELTTEQELRRGRIVTLVNGFVTPSVNYKDVK